MALRKAVVLLLALAVALVATAAAVAAEEAQLGDGAVEDRYVGNRKGGATPPTSPPTDFIAPRPPGRCLIRLCGRVIVKSLCPYYYRWYGRAYPLWSVLPDGGRVVGKCTFVPWCRGCFRCLARKQAKCVKVLPRFVKWWFCRKGAGGKLTPVLKMLPDATPART